MNKVILYARLVKFEHTVFAMPFALIGFFLATMVTDQVPFWKLLAEIIACMVFARNAAMAFNRDFGPLLDSTGSTETPTKRCRKPSPRKT